MVSCVLKETLMAVSLADYVFLLVIASGPVNIFVQVIVSALFEEEMKTLTDLEMTAYEENCELMVLVTAVVTHFCC